jgi:hypothetical protein
LRGGLTGTRRWLAALAAAGLVALVVACTGGHGSVTRTAGGGRFVATSLPSPASMHGPLPPRGADLAYSAVIVPAYPLALRLADALSYHPSLVPARASSLTASLSRALTALAQVSAFPTQAQAAFAAYRSGAMSLVASLAHPATVMASARVRRQVALRLYAFAEQIGDLGSDLNLVPATESGGKH